MPFENVLMLLFTVSSNVFHRNGGSLQGGVPLPEEGGKGAEPGRRSFLRGQETFPGAGERLPEFLQFFFPEPFPEPDQGGGFDDGALLEGGKAAEVLPIDILVEFLYGGGVGAAEAELEKVKACHETGRFSRSPDGAVAGKEDPVEASPVNPPGRPDQFVAGIQGVEKTGPE